MSPSIATTLKPTPLLFLAMPVPAQAEQMHFVRHQSSNVDGRPALSSRVRYSFPSRIKSAFKPARYRFAKDSSQARGLSSIIFLASSLRDRAAFEFCLDRRPSGHYPIFGFYPVCRLIAQNLSERGVPYASAMQPLEVVRASLDNWSEA